MKGEGNTSELYTIEERLDWLEGQAAKIKPVVKVNTRRLRNLRAGFILLSFLVTLFVLEVEKVEWSKEGRFSARFRDISIEAIAAGLVAASLVAGEDIGKIADRFLRK